MRLVLVGADFEENLGMCMIAAAAESRGHRTTVVPFQRAGERPQVVAEVLAARPDVVGLAAQFQHRGTDFLALARDLRRAGFRGHVTAGGQFATMAHQPILAGRYGVDSVVLYEGEHTVGELLDALASGRSLDEVAGLALPDGACGARRTAARPLVANLDSLPLAQRYRQHARPVKSSRDQKKTPTVHRFQLPPSPQSDLFLFAPDSRRSDHKRSPVHQHAFPLQLPRQSGPWSYRNPFLPG